MGATAITSGWMGSTTSRTPMPRLPALQKATDANVYAEFAVTGAVVDGTGYRRYQSAHRRRRSAMPRCWWRLPPRGADAAIRQHGRQRQPAAAVGWHRRRDGAGLGHHRGRQRQHVGRRSARSLGGELWASQVPATQNPSSDANTLDDYERDVDARDLFGGASVGITYGQRAGTYIKVGRMLYIDGNFTLSNKGSSTGEATMTIPFSLSSEPGGIPNYCTNFASITGVVMMWGQTTALKFRMAGATGTTNTSLTDANFTNTTTCYFSIVGRVSA